MEENNKDIKNSLLNNGLVISIVSGYAYLLAYSYEWGYCSYFGVPINLITPSLTSILLIIISFFLFIMTNLKLFGFFAPVFRMIQNPKYKALKPFIEIHFFFLFLYLILFLLYGFYWKIFLIFIIPWILLGGLYFLPVFLFDRKEKKFKERLSNYINQEDRLDLSPFLVKVINPIFIKYGLIAAFLAFLSYFIGNGEAYKQQDFYVCQNDSTSVFIRSFGNLFIFAKIDYQKKTIENKFRILNSTDVNKLELQKIRIGHLEIDDIKNFNEVFEKKEDKPKPKSAQENNLGEKTNFNNMNSRKTQPLNINHSNDTIIKTSQTENR